MKPTEEEIRKLLAARRDEEMGDAYWQAFVRDFHRRRSAEMASSEGRVRVPLLGLVPVKWACALGAAYTIGLGAFCVMPQNGGDDQLDTILLHPNGTANSCGELSGAPEALTLPEGN